MLFNVTVYLRERKIASVTRPPLNLTRPGDDAAHQAALTGGVVAQCRVESMTTPPFWRVGRCLNCVGITCRSSWVILARKTLNCPWMNPLVGRGRIMSPTNRSADSAVPARRVSSGMTSNKFTHPTVRLLPDNLRGR